MMKPWIKRILLAALALVVLVAAGLAALKVFFDPNAYAPEIEAYVSSHYHRNVQIDGSLKLALLPFPALTVSKATLTEADGRAPFASVTHVRLALAVLPLLHGEIRFDHLSVGNLQMVLRRLPDGTFNISDLFGAATPAGVASQIAPPVSSSASPSGASSAGNSAGPSMGTSAGTAAGPSEGTAAVSATTPAGASVAGTARATDPASAVAEPAPVNLPAIDIKDGTLHLIDEDLGQDWTISQFSLHAGELTDGRAAPVTVSGRVQGEATDAQFTTKLDVVLEPRQQRYLLLEVNSSLQGRLLGLSATSLATRGNLSVDRARRAVSLDGFEMVFRGAAAWRALPAQQVQASIALPHLSIDEQAQQFDLKDLALRVKGVVGRDDFELAMNAPALDVSPAGASGQTVSGRLRFNGPGGLDTSFEASGVGGNANVLTFGHVRATAINAGPQKSMQFDLSSPMTLDMSGTPEIALTALTGQALWHASVFQGGALPLPLSGTVSSQPMQHVARVDLHSTLGGAAVALQAQISDWFVSRATQFTLRGGKIDLDQVLLTKPTSPAPALGRAPSVTAVTAPAATPAPADFSSLTNLTIDGTVHLDGLSRGTLQATDVGAHVQARPGLFALSELHGVLAGGALQGSMSIADGGTADPRKRLVPGAPALLRWASHLQWRHMAIQPVLKALTDTDGLSGSSDGAIDVQAQGQTWDAWHSSMAGTASMTMGRGTLQTPGLVATVARALPHDALPVDAAGLHFSRLQARLALGQGVVTLSSLDMQAGRLQVTQGSPARTDLGARQWDLVLLAHASLGHRTHDPSLTVPVHVSGPWTKPSYRVETARAIDAVVDRNLGQGQPRKHVDRVLNELRNFLK